MKPARASGVAASLFVLLVGSWAETSTQEPDALIVPTPTEVEIRSYNLNPEVSWDYQNMSLTPAFTVELKSYLTGQWNEVCTNISQHVCNIFGHIEDQSITHWARVKATIGQKESSYALSKDFTCYRGKIGPPKIKVQQKDRQLIIDVYHPQIIVNGEIKGSMYDDDDEGQDCHISTYKMYLKINRSEDSSKEIVFDECNDTWCQFTMPAVFLNSEYCVSVQGVSHTAVTIQESEKSEEQCIKIVPDEKEDSSKTIPILLCLFLIICFLGLIFFLVTKRKIFEKKNIKLPKSLVSVVRSFNSHDILDVNSEPKSISVVEASYMTIPENEGKTPVSSINCEDNKEQSEHLQGRANISEEMTVEENITEMTSDSHQSAVTKENYFHSNSGQVESACLLSNSCLPRDDSENVESCNFISNPEPPQSAPETRKETQDNIPVRNINTSFGYDKPHVLVDMLIDTNDEESLIGYQPPELSTEIS